MKNYLTSQPTPQLQQALRRSSGFSQNQKGHQTVTLNILIGEYELILPLPRKTKISELNSIIKAYEKLHDTYGPVRCQPCCLASCDGYEVLDYWLLQDNKTLQPIKNGQRLKVLYVDCQYDASPLGLQDFQLLKCLGKGGSCAVYLVRCRRSCKLFALKQIAKQYISEYKRFEQILRQRKILQQLPTNQYTINCHTAFESDKHLNFILDYCPGGQLFYHIKEGLLSDDTAVKLYFCQVLGCIEFLHANKILYRDLKPQNILVDLDGHLRIADFGLSRIGFKQDEVADSYCGSPEYMAPQMLLQTGYGYTLDLYTLGVILYQFTTGLPPFYSQDQDQLFSNITHAQLQFPPELHPHLKKLLQKMLQKDPAYRIGSLQQIKQSPWFSDVNWEVVNQRTYAGAIRLDLYKTYIHEQFLVEDVSELNRQYSIANTSQPLFEFFKFQKPTCDSLLYGKQIRRNGSVRQVTEFSQKDSFKTKANQTQKHFIRSSKKSTENLKSKVQTLTNNSSTLQEQQPRQARKKITLLKKQNKQNSLTTSERHHSGTPHSKSLKKLTLISSKNFNSKRQSDVGGRQFESASRQGSRSKSKSVRHIMSTKKIAAIGRESVVANTDKKTLKSTYRIMLNN